MAISVRVTVSCAAAARGWRRRAHRPCASRLATAKRHTISCQRCRRCRRCRGCRQCGLRGGLCADWGRACVRAYLVRRWRWAGGVVLTGSAPLASPPLSVTLSFASVAAVAARAGSVVCVGVCVLIGDGRVCALILCGVGAGLAASCSQAVRLSPRHRKASHYLLPALPPLPRMLAVWSAWGSVC
jgi:hypothetical protein